MTQKNTSSRRARKQQTSKATLARAEKRRQINKTLARTYSHGFEVSPLEAERTPHSETSSDVKELDFDDLGEGIVKAHEYNVFVCRPCKQVVANPRNHLLKQHNVKLLKSSPLNKTLDCKLGRGSRAIKKALPFVKQEKGLACDSCGRAFKCAKSHRDTKCPEKNLRDTVVQRLGNGSHKITVEVLAPVQEGFRRRNQPSRIKEATEYMLRMNSEMIEKVSVKQINPFYKILNWLDDEQLALFLEHRVFELFEVPDGVSDDWAALVLDVFLTAFAYVEKLDFVYQCAVQYRKVELKTHLLYANMFVDVICFVINASAKAIDPEFPIQVKSFKDEAQDIARHPSVKNVFALLDKLISEHVTQSPTLVAACKVFCIDRKHLTRKQPGKVQPLMSALIKLHRIVVAKIGMDLCPIHCLINLEASGAKSGSTTRLLRTVDDAPAIPPEDCDGSDSEFGGDSSPDETSSGAGSIKLGNPTTGLAGSVLSTRSCEQLHPKDLLTEGALIERGPGASLATSGRGLSDPLCNCPAALECIQIKKELLNSLNPYPIQVIVSAHNLARSFAVAHVDLFIPDPVDPFRGSYKANNFNLRLIPEIYADGVKRASAIMKKLIGPLAKVDLVSGVKDCISGTRDLFHPLADEYAAQVLDSIMRDERARYVGRVVEFDESFAETFFRLHEEFMEVMLVVTHLGGCSPARMSELCELLITDCKDRVRNVFIVDGQMTLKPSAHKTDWIRCVAVAPAKELLQFRFLDPAVSRLWALDILVLRKLANIVAKHSVKGYTGDYTTRLYVVRGIACDSTKLGLILARQLRQSGFLFNARDTRQILKYACETLIVVALNRKTAGGESLGETADLAEFRKAFESLPTTFGHGLNTATTRYGVTEGAIPNVSRIDFAMQRNLHRFVHKNLIAGEFLGPTQVSSEAWPRTVVKRASDEMHRPLQNAAAETSRTLRDITPHPGFPSCGITGDPTAFVRVSNPSVADRALAGLKQVYGPSANWKSVEQESAVKLAVSSNETFLCVLPTGGGKSAVFSVHSVVQPARLSVVLVPTVALREELVERSLGTDELKRTTTGVCVLTYESVQCVESLRSLLKQLRTDGRLIRIFLDEAHVLVSDAFREPFRHLASLRADFAMTLLTATAPEGVRLALQAMFHVEQTIRSPSTDRPEIRYSAIDSGTSYLTYDSLLLQEISVHCDGSNRVVVFVKTPSRAQELALELQQAGVAATFYHSPKASVTDLNPVTPVDQSRLKKNFLEWKNGTAKVMVATSAFCSGIDYPAVRKVVVEELPFTFVDFVQMAGRGGRDGNASSCVLLYDSKGESSLLRSGKLLPQAKLEKEFLLTLAQLKRGECRRAFVTGVMDGAPGRNCQGDCVRCDNCELLEPSEAQTRPLSDDEWPEVVELFEPMPPVRCEDAQAEDTARAKSFYHLRELVLPQVVNGATHSICAVCFVDGGQRLLHYPSDCPRLKGSKQQMCYLCFNGSALAQHPPSACYFKGAVKDTCFKCWLPNSIDGNDIHSSIAFGKCSFFRAKTAWLRYWSNHLISVKHPEPVRALSELFNIALKPSSKRPGLITGMAWLMDHLDKNYIMSRQ